MRIELAVPVRRRRSQADRRAATRARVIAAVVDSIADVGFAGTTAQTIAGRAGVTWGAVQHHFGGKDGLLIAVVEDSFNRFADRMADLPAAATPLETRVAQFVDRAWAHFRSREFRSTFEILLNHLGRVAPAAPDDWRDRMGEAWDRIWTRIFPDAALPRARRRALQRYTIAALSGLAAMRALAGATAPPPRQELQFLAQTLYRSLAAGGKPARRSAAARSSAFTGVADVGRAEIPPRVWPE